MYVNFRRLLYDSFFMNHQLKNFVCFIVLLFFIILMCQLFFFIVFFVECVREFLNGNLCSFSIWFFNWFNWTLNNNSIAVKHLTWLNTHDCVYDKVRQPKVCKIRRLALKSLFVQTVYQANGLLNLLQLLNTMKHLLYQQYF